MMRRIRMPRDWRRLSGRETIGARPLVVSGSTMVNVRRCDRRMIGWGGSWFGAC
jgi:hypothetical protein